LLDGVQGLKSSEKRYAGTERKILGLRPITRNKGVCKWVNFSSLVVGIGNVSAKTREKLCFVLKERCLRKPFIQDVLFDLNIVFQRKVYALLERPGTFFSLRKKESRNRKAAKKNQNSHRAANIQNEADREERFILFTPLPLALKTKTH
jgi:hypothetical protein